MKTTIEEKVNEAIENFKKNNDGKKFCITFTEKDRKYPNGMYCHCVRIGRDRFFDSLCGNGWMWGKYEHIHFDDNGSIIASENFKNNTWILKDFESFNYSTKAEYTNIFEYLNKEII